MGAKGQSRDSQGREKRALVNIGEVKKIFFFCKFNDLRFFSKKFKMKKITTFRMSTLGSP